MGGLRDERGSRSFLSLFIFFFFLTGPRVHLFHPRLHLNPALRTSPLTTPGRIVDSGIHLDELEDGEGGRAAFGVNAAQHAVELRVEAAVPEAQQEAAQQGDGHAGRGNGAR